MQEDGLGNAATSGVNYDYFYGNEAELYTFYRIPKVLIENKAYIRMSSDAKLLYTLLLDRVTLSVANDWKDDYGRVYIIYTVEEVMRVLGCGNKKAIRTLMELEVEYRLIERRKQGFGKPNLIYVKSISNVVLNEHFLECQNDISLSVKMTPHEVSKQHAINNNNINTNYINNDPILSEGMDEDELKRQVMENYFYRNLSFDRLLEEYPFKQDMLRDIFDIIVDTLCSKRKTVRIGGEDKSKSIVHSQFMKLEANHIRCVLSGLENASNVKNVKQYILSSLYNATLTMNSYYALQYNNTE